MAPKNSNLHYENLTFDRLDHLEVRFVFAKPRTEGMPYDSPVKLPVITMSSYFS